MPASKPETETKAEAGGTKRLPGKTCARKNGLSLSYSANETGVTGGKRVRIGCANCSQLSVSALCSGTRSPFRFSFCFCFCLVSHSRLIMHKLKSNCKDDSGGGQGTGQGGCQPQIKQQRANLSPGRTNTHTHASSLPFPVGHQLRLAAPWRVAVHGESASESESEVARRMPMWTFLYAN